MLPDLVTLKVYGHSRPNSTWRAFDSFDLHITICLTPGGEILFFFEHGWHDQDHDRKIKINRFPSLHLTTFTFCWILDSKLANHEEMTRNPVFIFRGKMQTSMVKLVTMAPGGARLLSTTSRLDRLEVVVVCDKWMLLIFVYNSSMLLLFV